MKITKEYLQKVVKEEASKIFNEQRPRPPRRPVKVQRRGSKPATNPAQERLAGLGDDDPAEDAPTAATAAHLEAVEETILSETGRLMARLGELEQNQNIILQGIRRLLS